MKNNLLFSLLTFFLASGLLQAQGLESRYGFRVGVNYSSIVSDNFDLIAAGLEISQDNIEESRFGATAGFFAEYPLSELISIQPELQYSTQGNLNQELRLNYLQLPVFLKINISEMFNIHLGPQAGLKAWEWERNEDYNTFEFSAIGGLGINITDSFFADLRYSYGFTNIFEEIEGSPIQLEGNNTYIQFTIGYRL